MLGGQRVLADGAGSAHCELGGTAFSEVDDAQHY